MRIICDLDGTLFETYSRLKRTFEIVWGVKVTPEKYVALKTGNDLTEEELDWIRNEYFESEFAYIDLPTYPDAVAVLKILEKNNEVYYLTARNEKFRELTEIELEKLWLSTDKLIFAHRDKKANYIIKINPDFVIEDEIFPVLPILLSEKKIKVIMLERKWNENFKNGTFGVQKVKNWVEIMWLIRGGV